MAITAEDVWDWMQTSGDRRTETRPSGIVDRLVAAVEALWLDRWSILIRLDDGTLPDPRPEYIDQALIMQAARLYDRRKTTNGVIAGNTEMGPFRVSRFDPDVEAMINDESWGVG